MLEKEATAVLKKNNVFFTGRRQGELLFFPPTIVQFFFTFSLTHSFSNEWCRATWKQIGLALFAVDQTPQNLRTPDGARNATCRGAHALGPWLLWGGALPVAADRWPGWLGAT